MFHKNPAIKLLIDPTNGQIIEANSAASKFYGYSIDELRQMKIQQLNQLPEELVQREMERARNQSHDFFEFKHRLRSGELRDMQVYSSPCCIQGRSLLFSILVDITDRKRLSAQLTHAQRMDALGKMAGGIAHDFNNLLGAMEILTELLTIKYPDESHIVEIQELVQRGAGLTHQLLAFCRRQVVSSTIVNLKEIIQNTEQLLQRTLEKKIEIIMRLPDNPVFVWGDRTQFEQILINLALNARDAMPSGGRLMISLEQQDIPAGQQGLAAGKYWCWQVSDTGEGLSSQEISLIFEPFYSTKSEKNGTGLGLAVVYGVVHQYKGKIQVESKMGEGTTFTILLPCTPEETKFAEATLQRTTTSSNLSGSERILFAEDEPMIRRTIVEILRKRGYQVEAAQDGVEALAIARYQKFDLLLTDIMMPRMGGCDLAKALIQQQPHLRVLYLSGYQDSYSELGLLDAAEWFLAKPFSLDELFKKIREVLSKPPRRAISP